MSKKKFSFSKKKSSWRLPALAFVAVLLSQSSIFTPVTWAANRFKTLYTFSGGSDGSQPSGNLISDAAGNLYGTTFEGGGGIDAGVVFRLTPNHDGLWTESVLYAFNGRDGGGWPAAGLIFDSAGRLYGTTSAGGADGVGTVFQLSPHKDGTWTDTVLYSFKRDGKDGYNPTASLISDPSGNLYGTTSVGGTDGLGTVFQLTPKNGGWTESVLHSFSRDGKDGYNPYGSVILDSQGKLYGMTWGGGANGNYGTVFRLTPTRNGMWTETILHSFSFNGKDGANPYASLIFDGAGNLFGTTRYGGAPNGGTVFRMSPNGHGKWTESILHSFRRGGTNGRFPSSALIFDSAGRLYGTGAGGEHGYGIVFRLMVHKDGSATETVLHAFGQSEGGPSGSLIFGPKETLFGATGGNGADTWGSAFELIP